MRILCDLDGVVSDFVDSFIRCYRDAGGVLPAGWVQESYDFDGFPNQRAVSAAWLDKTLFSNMSALPGAVVALEHLDANHDVRIVTKIIQPWSIHIPARIRWIEVFLPFILPDQVYIAHDKTPINGDLLIEDYPPNLHAWLVERDCTPCRGALIDQPWNRGESARELMKWDLPWRWDRHEDLMGFVESIE